MFTEPTVFILGAGASVHFGYPTGAGLVDMLSKLYDTVPERGLLSSFSLRDPTSDLRINTTNYSFLSPHTCNDQTIGEKLGDFLELSKEFIGLLKQFSPTMIDSFLSENPRFESVGRLLISYCLLHQESDSRAKLQQLPCGWHRHLLTKLLSGIKKPDDLLDNKVNIITFTFNYDVTLDYWLYDSLRKVEILKKEAVDEFFKSGLITHVYGMLDLPPEQNLERSKYGKIHEGPSIIKNEDVFYARCNDLAFAHDRSADLQFMLIEKTQNLSTEPLRKIIGQSKILHFYGFGFDENNTKILGLPEILKDKTRSIYYTNYNDSLRINHLAKNAFGLKRSLQGNIYGQDSEFDYRNGNQLHHVIYKSTRTVNEALDYDFAL